MLLLVGTGGTIAEGPTRSGRTHLSAAELLEAIGVSDHVVDKHDLLDSPSTFLSLADMSAIVGAIDAGAARADIDGVVVTHGTDSLEETAFLAHLLVQTQKPVVITGAMRRPDALSADGPANLRDAILTAAAPVSYGLGPLVVLNGEIHCAHEVTKAHATALNAFRTLEHGPLGRVEGGRPHLFRLPAERIPMKVRELNARVEVMKAYAGIGSDLIGRWLDLPLDGLIIECMGSGQVPPCMLDGISEAIARGVTVVGTTRCPEGRINYEGSVGGVQATGDEAHLRQLGVIFSDLSGIKARLKLAVLLSGWDGVEKAETIRNAMESSFMAES